MPIKPFRNPYYAGPPSDHFDGRHFFNPGGEGPAPLSAILRWQLSREGARWPAAVDHGRLPDRPPPRVGGGEARLAAIGHSSFLVQVGGLNVLLDPVYSEQCPARFGPRRCNPPGIAFADLPPVDVVCVSHSHYDHMDRPTLERLHRRDRPRFVVPLGCDRILAGWDAGIQVTTLDWWDRIELGEGVAVTLAPAHHWSARGVLDRRMTLWGSFSFETPAGLIHTSGDTGFFEGRNYRAARERLGAPKLAVLPMGAYAPRFVMRPQHQDPDEAVRGALILGAELTLGSHWGTFQLTDEAPFDPPARVAAACRRWGLAPERFLPAAPGLVVELPARIDAPPPPPLPETAEAWAPTPDALFGAAAGAPPGDRPYNGA